MTCSFCNTGIKKDLKITDLSYTKKVEPFNTYTISVTVKNLAWLYGDTAKLCLYDRSTGEYISSQSEHMSPGSTKLFVFNEQMTVNSLKLNISLIDENVWPIADDCEDYRNFTIYIPGESSDIGLWVVLAAVAAIIIFIVLKR